MGLIRVKITRRIEYFIYQIDQIEGYRNVTNDVSRIAAELAFSKLSVQL